MDRDGFASMMGTLPDVFDPEQQVGAAEDTYRGTRTYHGITLVRLEDDRIADWREYQYPSELDWEAFSAGNRS